MKKSALIIMTLLFLLVGSTNANVIASTSQAFNIPSYAVISYPGTFSGWEKTIAWSDGTTETIRIDSRGNVYLNDTLGQALGWEWFGWLGSPSNATVDTILSYMQSKGVRFQDVTYYVVMGNGNPGTYQLSSSYMGKLLDKFYEYKMWTTLILKVHWDKAFDYFNTWSDTIDDFISYIDDNGWSDMIWAIQVTHEVERYAKSQGKTVAELGSLYDDYYNRMSWVLSTSQIGSVPILHGQTLWGQPSDTTWRDYWKKVLEKTDVPMITFYPKHIARMDIDLTEIRDLMAQVGKDPANGYKIWHEFGRHVFDNDTDPQYVPLEHFTHLLDQNDTAYVFLFYVYENWDPSPEYPTWYFNNSGIAEYWTELLAPYFP